VSWYCSLIVLWILISPFCIIFVVLFEYVHSILICFSDYASLANTSLVEHLRLRVVCIFFSLKDEKKGSRT